MTGNLVLTRELGETIRIITPSGDHILVTVVEVQSWHKVRLAVRAEKAVLVHREEVYWEIQGKAPTKPGV